MNRTVGLAVFCYVMTIFVGVTVSQGCPEYNCSQGVLFDEDDVFKCDIRNKRGWEDFQKKHNVSDYYSSRGDVSMTAPMLTAINWYTTSTKVFGTVMFNPSLNVTFRVPIEKNTEFYAVLLKFESPDVPNWKDEFFVDKPRYRLFDFHQYSPSWISSDKIFYREISYRCIQYLNENDSMRLYHITLTGFSNHGATPGVSITHLVTTYNPPIRKLNPVLDLKEWKSTIVMTVIPGTYHIYVVFETAPVRVLYYQIELLKNIDSSDRYKMHQSVQVDHPINNYTFKNNIPGKYKVKVTPYSQKCSGVCLSSESFYITINKITDITNSWSPYKIPVLAAVIVLLVVASVVFCKRITGNSSSRLLREHRKAKGYTASSTTSKGNYKIQDNNNTIFS